ncbi:hypothetical protein E0K83_03905 [Gramella sp. BOM4]|nr:hypothetical protein [Christiangramia bathymodioli]
MTLIPLQAEASLSKFADYGLPGLIILTLIIAVGYLFKILQNNSVKDRERADKSNEAFVELSKTQNETNKKIVEVCDKIADQNKTYHDDTTRRLEEMPEKIIREFEFRQLQQANKPNNTPARS